MESNLFTEHKGKMPADFKDNKKSFKIFNQTNKLEKYRKEEDNNGIPENGFEKSEDSPRKPSDDVFFENHQNGFDNKNEIDENKLESYHLESYFPKFRNGDSDSFGSNDQAKEKDFSSEEIKDEQKFLTNKPFLSLNREKSNKNLKPANSAKLPSSIISTTNLGQGLTLPGKLTRHKSETKLKEKVIDNNVLPESMKGMGQEGIVRFLKAKVKMLTEQLEIIQKDEKKHIEKIKGGF